MAVGAGMPLTSHQSVFLVPNAHCPTCATSIDGLLAHLQPPPSSVATSIVSHTVTVCHDQSLEVHAIAKTLNEAGYEVESIIPDPRGDVISLSSRRSKPPGSSPTLLTKAFGRWARKGEDLDEETRTKRHKEYCGLCRDLADHAGSRGWQSPYNQVPSRGQADYPLVVVDKLSSQLENRFKASISITGMSCSSCVGKIVAALEETPRVISVNVALITQSATVEFIGGDLDATRLIDIINDLGYDSSLEQVEKLSAKENVNPPTSQDIWKAFFSIEGMTCSSCVGTITETLQSLSYVESAEVNLITNSAMVVFEGKSHLELIATEIEDAGYGASLNDVTPVSTEARGRGEQRSVSIRVDGFHCGQCPGRILDAIMSFEGRIVIDKFATVDDPIVTISYIPNSPEFTIRAIISAIVAADPGFRPSIHHPPSVEQRARQMHARVRRRIFRRVLLSIIVAIPTFIIGIVYMSLVPKNDPGRHYLMKSLGGVSRAEWALFIMATPVYLFAADVFHRRAVKEVYSNWKPGSSVPLLRRFYRFGSMDLLMSLGTSIAYFSSIAEIIIAARSASKTSPNVNTTYFDSVVFLTLFLLIGRLIEAYSKAKAGDAVSTLQHLRPKEALLLLRDDGKEADDRIETIGVDMIEVSDLVRVVHGSSPPWDGIVLSGNTVFDESSLTGESKPVKKTAGDPIYSGTINKGGPISAEITRISGDSMLDQIIRVVREGQSRRAPIERMADSITSYFVPVVTLIAISTWITWLSLGVSGSLPPSYLDVDSGGWPFWSLQFAIAVFIIACPCGIGLATPTALFVGGGLAAKHGILVKGGGEAFQEASRLDIVVFDKTGTLTQGGDPKVTDYQFLLPEVSVWNELQVQAALRHLEGNSSHPIGTAIVGFLQSTSEPGVRAEHIEEVAGKGILGSFDVDDLSFTMEVMAGNEALMSDHGISLDEKTSTTLDSWKTQAKSVVIVAVRMASKSDENEWEPAMMIAISDALRPESHFVIESLARQGVEVWMLSGDNPTTATAVGAMVGIPKERIIAGVLPQQKADKIKYLQRSQLATKSRSILGISRVRSSQRAIVAMVGDGVNDSPALSVADIGIAVGSGSDVAISSADFVLVNHSMTTILTLVSLSRVVFRRVKFNFAWALVYNLLAMPVAAGVLYPLKSSGTHIRLDPVWASLAMALSSISVVCSSLLMRTRLPILGFRASEPDM